jgi:hypothetical protein
MEITPPDNQGALSLNFDGTFDAPGENGGTQSNGTMSLSFKDPESSSDVSGKLEFTKAIGSDKLPHFTLSANGEGDGQAFDLNIGYEGKTATETEQTGTVKIDFNAPELGKGNVSFDVKLETGELKALDSADFEGKTKIDPLSATEEEMTQLQTELQGVMMQAFGVLMQTPGLSNIMGGMMNSGVAG